MERFVVKSTPSCNCSKTTMCVTAGNCIKEFGGELHEDGGILFCSSCNVVLDHIRKSTIGDHLKSRIHANWKAEFEGQSMRKKQRTLTTSLWCNTAAQTEIIIIIKDFVKTCLEAHIPLEKADHPSVQTFLSQHVKHDVSISLSDQLRRVYLPDVYENKKQLLKTETI
uniref:CGG triplet repeat binding protein 1 n=1 Tax=Latimeria chalumnae TaxID=7897 RepID=H3B8A1_LATCH